MDSPDAYTNPREHLSQGQLIRYRQGNMADAEMHRVERHLLACDLCNDAAEGLEMLDPGQSGRALQDLEGRFHSRLAPEKRTAYWKWGVAASVLLLAGSLFFLLTRSFKPEGRQNHRLVQRMPEARKESQDPAGAQEHLPPYLSYREEEKEKKPAGEPEIPAPAAEENTQPAPAPERADREAALPRAREEPERNEAVSSVYPEAPSNEVSQDLVLEEVLMDYPAAKKEVYRDSVADRVVRSSRSERATQVRGKAAKRLAAPAYKKQSAERDTLKSKTLKGKVIDGTGEPLPGVNIRLAGSRKTVVSNVSGEYSLQLPVADTAVQISYVGYETQKLFVPDSATQLLSVLEEDVAALSEVVVMGYDPGQRSVTGAVATVPEIIPPRPAGGRRSFKKYLKENQRYTPRAREAGIAGVVVLEFYVEEDSTFSNFQVRKSLGYGLDEEAIRLVKEGPDWQPATSGKETIRQKAKVKVRFRPD